MDLKIKVNNITTIEPRQTTTAEGQLLIVHIDTDRRQIEHYLNEVHSYFGDELIINYLTKNGYTVIKKNTKE